MSVKCRCGASLREHQIRAFLRHTHYCGAYAGRLAGWSACWGEVLSLAYFMQNGGHRGHVGPLSVPLPRRNQCLALMY